MSDDPVKKRNNARFVTTAMKAFTPLLEDRELFGRETFIAELDKIKDFFKELGSAMIKQAAAPPELVRLVQEDYLTIIDAIIGLSDTIHHTLTNTDEKAAQLQDKKSTDLLN